MIYNQLAYLFQQLLIAKGLRRSYNDSGFTLHVRKSYIDAIRKM